MVGALVAGTHFAPAELGCHLATELPCASFFDCSLHSTCPEPTSELEHVKLHFSPCFVCSPQLVLESATKPAGSRKQGLRGVMTLGPVPELYRSPLLQRGLPSPTCVLRLADWSRCDCLY